MANAHALCRGYNGWSPCRLVIEAWQIKMGQGRIRDARGKMQADWNLIPVTGSSMNNNQATKGNTKVVVENWGLVMGIWSQLSSIKTEHADLALTNIRISRLSSWRMWCSLWSQEGMGTFVHPSGSENFCEVRSNPAHMFSSDCKNCLDICYWGEHKEISSQQILKTILNNHLRYEKDQNSYWNCFNQFAASAAHN